MTTAFAAVMGARLIKERAQDNILATFIQHTGRLYRSMYSDPVATMLGDDDFTARAYPRGPQSPEGTPYGRIQELGGIIRPTADNPTGLLWFDSIRQDGSFGVISVPEVQITGMFYLRDAVIMSIPDLRNQTARMWQAAIEE
jgi:hypothetical protein